MAFSKKRNSFPLLTSFLYALLTAILLKMFFLDVFSVTGSSMEPTIPSGTIIYINRLAYGLQIPFIDKYLFFWQKPSPGDIVVFFDPLSGKRFVKRCIASGSDINSNSKELKNKPMLNVLSEEFPNEQPSDKALLVLGDNYLYSIDSRNFGLISVDQVRGKVILFTVPRHDNE